MKQALVLVENIKISEIHFCSNFILETLLETFCLERWNIYLRGIIFVVTLIERLIDWWIEWLIIGLIGRLIDWFIIYWLIGLLDCWVYGLMEWWIVGLMDWWIDGFMDWWIDGLMDWLIKVVPTASLQAIEMTTATYHNINPNRVGLIDETNHEDHFLGKPWYYFVNSKKKAGQKITDI